MKYWDKVNPDLPDLDSDILVKPAVLTPEQCLDFVLSKIARRTSSSTAGSSATTESTTTTSGSSSHPVLSVTGAINLRQFMMAQETAEYNLRSPKEQQIQLWISACVESNAYNTITSRLTTDTGKSDFSLRQPVKALKKKFSPGDYILKASLSSQYKALLQDAHRANTNPDRWLDAWVTLYPRASRVKNPELKGPNAVRDFLSAVGNRFEPDWALSKLSSPTICRCSDSMTSFVNFGKVDACTERIPLGSTSGIHTCAMYQVPLPIGSLQHII
ncbi:hypothetical protein E4U61_007656 [Claviceps capensis]|nr:hypothetical protein E4U61_007656 [Claviceps capensis]